MVVKYFSPHSKNLVQFRFTDYKDLQWSELLTIISIQNPCSGVNHTVHDKNKDLQSSYYTPLEYKKYHQITLKHKNCVALKSQIHIIRFPCNISKNILCDCPGDIAINFTIYCENQWDIKFEYILNY